MLTALQVSIFWAIANVVFVNAQSVNDRMCSVNFEKNAPRSQMLYLEPYSMEWRYPMDNYFEPDSDGHLVRIVCPGGTVKFGENVTAWKSSVVDCAEGSAVKISGTNMMGSFNEFECTGYEEPTSRLTGRQTPSGRNIAQIGYFLGPNEFLPVIDEIAVSEVSRGYIPRWAHYMLYNMSETMIDRSKNMEMKMGPISGKIDFMKSYNRILQREVLLQTVKDDDLINLIMPAEGTGAFIPARLVDPEDFYYEAQQNATNYYELTTPVWNSIAEGNWKLTGKIVRYLASQGRELEVYSGTYLSLYLEDKFGMISYIRLPGDLRPAQFLFRFIVDNNKNEGIVLITVNNPILKKADQWNVLCEPIQECAAEMFNEFKKFKNGYTYCCAPADFMIQAERIGLPVEKLSGLSVMTM